MRNDLRQLMEIAQQLEPYVRSSEMEYIGSSKASAADLLSSSKGHRSRKQQHDATQRPSGSQFQSTALLDSSNDLKPALRPEIKQRLVRNSRAQDALKV